eukprot:TRINITY_DN8300_c0_g1_i3.p1 TRINITY_DN8300_c0_g1~~TRINITY_DN8300_c0_g1_i3.p1  ORF type:complete len:184 (+),score=18.22 TRINITY_DN8300_c0_g1_i3:29-553(+)
MSMDIIVARKYRLDRKLGSGSFGDIYLGVNIYNEEEMVAIKLEIANSKHAQLEYEAKLYSHLLKNPGIPHTQWLGTEGEYKIMTMELLGPSLEDLFNFCQRKFSVHTVLMLADQLIRRVEYVHSRNFLHRDIKPDNFLMGIGPKSHQCYIIDFGLAKRYRSPQSTSTTGHIPFK